MSAPTPGAAPRRARRVLAGLAIAVAAIAVLVAGLGFWVVGTQPGARWAFERLGGFLPGELDADSLIGPIRGPLVAKNVRFRSDRVEITIRRLALNWSLRDLLRQRLDIHRFEADSALVKFFAGDSVASAPDTTALPDIDLPLDVMIRSGRIRDLEITLAGSDTAIVIDEIGFANLALRDTLTIGALSVDSRMLTAEVHGRADPHGRYATDLAVRWRYRTAEGELAGAGRVAGDLDTLRVIQDVSEPFEATVRATVFDPLRQLRFLGVVEFSDLRLAELDPQLPPARASGRVEFSGTPETLSSQGTLTGAWAPFERVHAVYALDKHGPLWNIRQLIVTPSPQADRIDARGTVEMSSGVPRFALDGTWRRLRWPLGESRLVSPSGRFRVQGTADRYRLTASGPVGLDDIAPAPWRVSGTGSTEAIAFDAIEGGALGGSVRGRGTVDWRTAAVGWDLDVEGRGLDPSTAWPAWPGEISFDLDTRGRANEAGARGEIAMHSLSGAVRGHPVSGAAAAGFAPGHWNVHDLDLGWGPNRLAARGAIGGTWTLAATLDAPDLSVAGPGAGGSLDASVEVAGARSSPRVAATLDGDSLRWNDWSLHRLTGSADVDARGRGPSQFVIEGSGLSSAGRQIEHVLLRGDGRADAHEIRATASAGNDSVALALDGGWARSTWTGRLSALDLVTDEVGTWNLESPAPMTASARRLTLDGFAWRSGAARVTADVDWRQAAPWRATGELENLNLSLLQPLLANDLTLEGPVNGPIAVGASASGRLLAEADLAVGPGVIGYDRPGGRGEVRLDPGTIAVRSDDAGIAGAMALSSPDAGTVRGDVRFAASGGPQPRLQNVSGNAEVLLTNLDFVQGFVPDVSGTAGRFEANLQVDGTFARPRWRGDARLSGAQADLTRLGVALRDVNLTAQSDPDGRLAFRAGARSGPGDLAIEGDALFTNQGVPRATATVVGQRFQAMGTEDVTAYVSPDLRLSLVGDSLRVLGEIAVPEAEFRAEARDDAVIPPSNDVVIVGAPQQWERRLGLYAEVRLVLGEDIQIEAYGLEAKPTGSVLVIDRPGWPSTGTGELRLEEGTYTAYAQDLTIERGRLVFGGGPVNNPGLDIRAVRRSADGVVAGFEVRGTLEQPRLSLFSEPVMAERDALAYIVLGRPLDRGSESDQGIVDEAAGALGVRSGNWLASKLGSQIGLDEASIQTTGRLDQATLMLGTYLSPRVYVNYGVGILDPQSTLRIQYFLHRRWTLQAETGEETSARILYTVER